MKPRLAILISGRGSNMAAIVDNCSAGLLCAEIAFVASDNPEAGGLLSASQREVPTYLLPYSPQGGGNAERRLENLLEDHSVEWLVLAGFMRILSPRFVAPRKGRIVTIHTSLLPSFPGRDYIRAA